MYRKTFSSPLFRGISWIFIATSIASVLRFLLIFILIRFYTQEEFGLWASITSLAAVIMTGDFGIVNVLRNLLSKEIVNGAEGDLKSKELFYSAFFSFLFFAIIFSVLIIFISPYIPYETLFKTDNIVLKEQGRSIFIVVQIVFLLGIPFGLGTPLFFSYGETNFYSIISIVQAVISFIIVFLLSVNHVEIYIISILYFICNMLLSLYGTLLFIHKRKWYSVNLSYRKICSNMCMMLPIGIKFLGIQLSSSFITNVLTVYSGSMLGLSIAANVNVIQKVYMFLTGIYQSIFNPMWSSLSLNFFKRRYSDCKIIINRSLISTIVIFSLTVLLCSLFRNYIMHAIAGAEYEANSSLFILIGLFFMAKLLFDNASLLHNAINRLNILITGYILFSCIVFLFVPYVVNNYGLNTMLFILIICWIIFIIAILCDTHKLLKDRI